LSHVSNQANTSHLTWTGKLVNKTWHAIQDEDNSFPQNRYFRLVVDVSMRNSNMSERKDKINNPIACCLDRYRLQYSLLDAGNKMMNETPQRDLLRKIDLRLSPVRN
jgi:hypothetical protein